MFLVVRRTKASILSIFFPFKDLFEYLLTRNKQGFFFNQSIRSPPAVAAAADWQLPNPYKSLCETFRLSKNTIVSKYRQKTGYVTLIHTALYFNLSTSFAIFCAQYHRDYLPSSVSITIVDNSSLLMG